MRPHVIIGAIFGTLLLLPPAVLGEEETLGEGLAIQDKDGVTYVSGGIGDAQQEILKGVSNRFNLKLTMATKDDKYIGDANIQITGSDGRTVISTQSNGPLFYAKLDPGSYDIQATSGGNTLTRQVKVPAQGQEQVVLTWPRAAEPIAAP